MACPRCGGTGRLQIAPNLYRCTSTVSTLQPTGLHPSGVMGQSYRRVAVTCGHEYQEGAGIQGAPCYCGTDSIGSCQECHRRVCGLHSGIFNERRLCLEDLEGLRDRVHRQAVAEEEDRRLSEVQALVEARTQWLSSIADANIRAIYSALLCTRLWPAGRVLESDLEWIRKAFCSPINWEETSLLRPSADFAVWDIEWERVMAWGGLRTPYTPVTIQCVEESWQISRFSNSTSIKRKKLGTVKAWLVSDGLGPTWISEEARKLHVRNGKSTNGRGNQLGQEDIALILTWLGERPGYLASNPWGNSR